MIWFVLIVLLVFAGWCGASLVEDYKKEIAEEVAKELKKNKKKDNNRPEQRG